MCYALYLKMGKGPQGPNVQATPLSLVACVYGTL